MWDNLLFQLLLLFMIFAMIHAIYIRMNDVQKPLTKEKYLPMSGKPTTKNPSNKPRVQFNSETHVHNYNPDTPEAVYKKTQKLDDSFLYDDVQEPAFSESRSEKVVGFSEYPDNCGDERTIAEIHDEFLHRDITTEMDRGDINGVYKSGQYDLNDNIETMGYSDFATY